MFSEILRCPILVGASNCTQLMNQARMNSRKKDEILGLESCSMEEGEYDGSPSASERGHDDQDDNNNINPWEDMGSPANRGDDDHDNDRSRSRGLKLCIKIKTDHSNKKSKVCHICNKGGFTTSEALIGHMRMHSLSTKLALKANQGTTHHVSSTSNNNTNCCYLCRKSFPTIKSLCGHMRSHPEREWRGIQPPLHLHVASSSNSTSSSSNHSASASAAAVVVDLSRSLPRWSVTAKRGRKSLSSSCQNNLRRVGVEEVEKHHMQEEGVYELMLLADVAPKKTVLQCQEEDTSRMMKKNKLLAGCSVESSDSLKSFNKIGYEEEEEDEDSDFQNSDHGSIVGTDMGIRNRNEKKLNEIGTTVQGNETKTLVEDVVIGSCSINKTFSIGEALGDHKMISHWNWTGREETQSSQATSLVEKGQSCPKNLSFDLNLPATMDEEEEGIQSDLIIPPTNILPSSDHASSSQNSVSNW